MWFGGMRVTEYNPVTHEEALRVFFRDCDVVNNASMDALALNKRDNSFMFLVWDQNRIVNTSYVHDFGEYYEGAYRAFTRTATLPSYRTQGVAPRKDMTSAAGLAALTAHLQVDYALLNGADRVLFTTNTTQGGMASSAKLGRFLQRVEPHDPRFSFVEEREVYGVPQLVWQLHFRDILSNPPKFPI